jgi:Fe-Mn family superoxide dismutase
MDYHYNKHHKAYVDKLNELIEGTDLENETLDKIIVKTSKRTDSVKIFNNAAQHFNHSFFWKCMAPNGKPVPAFIKKKIEEVFGSFDAFRAEV